MFKNLKYIKLYDILSIFIFLLLLIPSLFYRLYLRITGRRIWLITEDGHTARDNGYNFFKYMREEHKDFKAYYVISKKSPDYKKVAKYKNVIRFRGIKHWIYYLSCEYNISSQKNGNPAQALFYVLHVKSNLFNNRVFLQHGITINETKYIFYNETKFKYLTCGAKREYEYMKEKFGYPDGSLLLTGLARNDALLDGPKVDDKQILIMPSWRSWLGRETNRFSKQEPFAETDFYKNWNGLLNDKSFIDFIEANNIKVKFYPHINMQKFLGYFKPGSKNIEIVSTDTDIQDTIKQSAIMITDYSSASMDSAILKRPLAYFQFDQKEYRKKQYNPGYFDYEKDGFGPVTQTISETVAFIKKSFNGKKFEIQDKYLEKSNAFFTETQECSHKIYENLSNSHRVPSRKEKIETALLYLSMFAVCISAFTIYTFYTITPVMLASIVIILYRIRYKVKLRRRFYLFEGIYLLFMLCAIISSVIFSFAPAQSFKIFLKITILIICMLQYRTLFQEVGMKRVKKAIYATSFIFVLVTLALYVAGLYALNFQYDRPNVRTFGVLVDRKTPRLITPFNIDPNQSCVFLMIPLLLALCFYSKSESKKEKIIKILLITGYLATILLTLSRGGIIALLFTFAIFFVFNQQRLLQKIKLLGIPILIIAVIAAIITAGINIANALHVSIVRDDGETIIVDSPTTSPEGTSAPLTMTDRFSVSISDKGSGRLRIWGNALKTFSEYPIFGVGVGSTRSYGVEKYNEDKFVHNIYLEVLTETGIFGFIPFAVFIIMILAKCFSSRKSDMAFSLILMISLLANDCFLSNQYNEIFFIHILIVDLCIGFLLNDSQKNKKQRKIADKKL